MKTGASSAIIQGMKGAYYETCWKKIRGQRNTAVNAWNGQYVYDGNESLRKKKFPKVPLFIMLLVLCAAFAACSGSGSAQSTSESGDTEDVQSESYAAADDTSSDSSFQNDSYVDVDEILSESSFQNDSYVDIDNLWEETETTVTKCLSCGGTGICDTCGGDGTYRNKYNGHELECPNRKSNIGVCNVCDGTGYWGS